MKPRVKVSVSLANELLDEIDSEAKRSASTRSRIIEIWLELAARRRAAKELEQDTIRYYQERTADQTEDDVAWARLAVRGSRALKIDSRPKTRRAG